MLTRIILTQRSIDTWAASWPCSTLATGWVEVDATTGDLVDMGGRIAHRIHVDAHELTAYLDDRLPAHLRRHV